MPSSAAVSTASRCSVASTAGIYLSDRCAASARSTASSPAAARAAASSGPESPRSRARPGRRRGAAPAPSSAALAAQSGPSPSASSARSWLQSEMSSERSATASVSPNDGDAHEPVRVEVVAEQERDVGVGRREEPRPAVVHEVALVDRLEPDRVPRLGERREDRHELALAAGDAQPAPTAGSRAPASMTISSHISAVERRDRRRPCCAISSSPCASETNIASNCDGAT